MNWRKTLNEHYHRLQENVVDFAEEMDCIDHVVCITGDFYDAVVAHMLRHNISEVVDIGCAYGHQGEAFIQAGLNYLGIESDVFSQLYKENKGLAYIKKAYPCPLSKKYQLGCSNLCYGYFIHDYEALARDFDEVILGNINDKEEIEKFFSIEIQTFPSIDPKEPEFEVYVLKRIREEADETV